MVTTLQIRSVARLNAPPEYKDEYLVTDKAYQPDRHIITPYKEPVSR